MTDLLEDLCDFLNHSPTSWHAATEMGNRLASLDFTPLFSGSKWELERGGHYFFIQSGSLAAFALPEKAPQQMAIITAHTDSPALKLKPTPFYQKHGMDLLDVETYGTPLLSTWANRDLAIAGQVSVRHQDGQIHEHHVFFDDTPVFIPILAPHLDRTSYDKGLHLHAHDPLIPVAGLGGEGIDPCTVETLLRRELCFETLIASDLFLVPIDEPRFIGKNGKLLASYRLDNLASSHAALTAMGSLAQADATILPITLFWDHEEVGSQTPIGAYSPFFKDLYERICGLYDMPKEDEILLRQNSLCLCVDQTHAANAAYQAHDDHHRLPRLGKGIALKYNANMRYTTTARTATFVSWLCDRLNLKLQRFVNPSNHPGGSTTGPPFASQMGIETAEIGIPQLSMHAAREVIACSDHLDMSLLLTAFLKGGT